MVTAIEAAVLMAAVVMAATAVAGTGVVIGSIVVTPAVTWRFDQPGKPGPLVSDAVGRQKSIWVRRLAHRRGAGH